jgi:hypothetical protein
VSIPAAVRESIKSALWKKADQLNWVHLSSAEKSKQYESWTKSPEIGATLSRYMDSGRVRVYIKDTLLKDYTRSRRDDASVPYKALGLREDVKVTQEFTKPHGRLLHDGRIISWGNAEDWKAIVTAQFERAYAVAGASAYGIVLFGANGKWDHRGTREMIEAAAAALGTTRVVWVSF